MTLEDLQIRQNIAELSMQQLMKNIADEQRFTDVAHSAAYSRCLDIIREYLASIKQSITIKSNLKDQK